MCQSVSGRVGNLILTPYLSIVCDLTAALSPVKWGKLLKFLDFLHTTVSLEPAQQVHGTQ